MHCLTLNVGMEMLPNVAASKKKPDVSLKWRFTTAVLKIKILTKVGRIGDFFYRVSRVGRIGDFFYRVSRVGRVGDFFYRVGRIGDFFYRVSTLLKKEENVCVKKGKLFQYISSSTYLSLTSN